jgi:hypothetical protein
MALIMPASVTAFHGFFRYSESSVTRRKCASDYYRTVRSIPLCRS